MIDAKGGTEPGDAIDESQPDSEGKKLPQIEVYVHPEHELPAGFDLERIRSVAATAVGEVVKVARAGAVLLGLEEVEVTLVSDATIADVHVEFMDIEGATDVITFDHGEILISMETAATQGAENGNSIERETALYVVHGLLHLAGYADKSEEEFAEMARIQEECLTRVW